SFPEKPGNPGIFGEFSHLSPGNDEMKFYPRLQNAFLRGMISLYTKWRCFHGTIGKICPQPADHAPVCDEEFFPGVLPEGTADVGGIDGIQAPENGDYQRPSL